MSFSIRKQVVLILAVLVLGSPLCLAQDPIKPPEGIPEESDWLYRQHYEQVQEIMKLSLDTREAVLESYMKKLNPKNKIGQYMEGFFGQLIRDYGAAGQNAKADALRGRLATLFPNSAAVKAQQQAQALQDAWEKQDFANVIKLGEPIYQKNPSDQLMFMLAQSYLSTGNRAKSVEFSQKVINSVGVQKGIYYAAWLADYHLRQGDQAQATTQYAQILQAYPGSPPEGWKADDWNPIKTRAYELKATEAYIKQDFLGAIANYEDLLRVGGQSDSAYLYIGLSHWKLGDLDKAMDSFAKAVVLGKTQAAKAREYLEQIYKPRNNDSLEGLDVLLDKAKLALGV